MTRFFHLKKGSRNYKIDHLLTHVKAPFAIDVQNCDHIICDIDKTYLETEYDSFVKLAKIAFQTAEDKKTVIGAKNFL